MAQTNYTPIQLYYSTTAAAAPTAGNLASGELAINITDGKLFYKDNAGVVQTLATKAATGGTFGAISVTSETNSGTLTLSGGTANGVAYLNGSKVLTTGSALAFDGTNLLNSGALRLTGGASSNIRFEAGGSEYARVMGNGSNSLDFAVGGTTPNMSLTSTGLGIGTSSPTNSKLEVTDGSTYFQWIGRSVGVDRAINLRAATGYNASILFTQNGVADRWAIGTKSGDGSLYFSTGDSLANGTVRIVADSAGNLGLGVTPSAWGSNYKALQIGLTSTISNSLTDDGLELVSNGYAYGTNTWKYLDTYGASRYRQSNSAHYWYNAPSGTAGNAITFTQAMTLDANGNLGIGTTSFAAKLQVLGPIGSLNDTAGTARIETDASGTDVAGALGAGLVFAQRWQNASGTIRVGGVYGIKTFGTGNFGGGLAFYAQPNSGGDMVERARIDSSGNWLVGTTTASSSITNGFTVTGAAAVTSLGVGHVTGSGSGTNYVVFNYNGGSIGSITQAGTTGVLFNITSDYRLKDIAGPVTNSGTFIDKLNPVQGSWKADGSRFIGFLAHELQEASETTVGTGIKDGEEMQSIDYSNAELIANLVAEIQSLRKRLAAAGI